MNWPEAVVAIVAIVSTLIYLACTNWYWSGDTPEQPKQQQDRDTQDWEAAKAAQRHHDALHAGHYPTHD